jgi:hypothetical protein
MIENNWSRKEEAAIRFEAVQRAHETPLAFVIRRTDFDPVLHTTATLYHSDAIKAAISSGTCSLTRLIGQYELAIAEKGTRSLLSFLDLAGHRVYTSPIIG